MQWHACMCRGGKLGNCKKFPRGPVCRNLALWRLAQQEPEQDRMNSTASWSTLFFEDNWLNKPSHISLTNVGSSCGPLPASPIWSPSLSKHQCSIACSLWLICRECHPGEQHLLTSQSYSEAKKSLKFALITTAAVEGVGVGGGVARGVGCVNANVTNMKMDYYSIQSSTLGECTSLKIAVVQE